MTYTICESCIDVKDRACVDECPVDCIYEGTRMLYIHPDECVDCGACEPVCPVTAIFYEDDVPAEWKNYTPINAEFFNEEISGIGSPGGAAQVGPVDKDHPFVTAFACEMTESMWMTPPMVTSVAWAVASEIASLPCTWVSALEAKSPVAMACAACCSSCVVVADFESVEVALAAMVVLGP